LLRPEEFKKFDGQKEERGGCQGRPAKLFLLKFYVWAMDLGGARELELSSHSILAAPPHVFIAPLSKHERSQLRALMLNVSCLILHLIDSGEIEQDFTTTFQLGANHLNCTHHGAHSSVFRDGVNTSQNTRQVG
jgi:hypothetical protein